MIETYEIRAFIESPNLIRLDVRGITVYLSISDHDLEKIERQLDDDADSLFKTLLFKLNY